MKKNSEDAFPWHLQVFDAHCHPTDTISSIKTIPTMKAAALTIMATRAQDQELVAQCAKIYGATSSSFVSDVTMDKNIDTSKETPCQVVPSFGWHPWFSHHIYDDSSFGASQISGDLDKLDHYKAILIPFPDDLEFLQTLPAPRPLSDYIAQTRTYLQKFPFALVGEIGLDRSFRIPEHPPLGAGDDVSSTLTPGGREGRQLSPYRVHMDHQKRIFKAQLNLAGEMSRPVSVHGVAAHGTVFTTLQEIWRGHEKPVVSKRARKRSLSVAQVRAKADETEEEKKVLDLPGSNPFPPRICLHSYSGPPDTVKQYLHPSVPATIFYSFSQIINFSSSDPSKVIEVIRAIPDDRLLVESDTHCAGERMDGFLEQSVRSICQIKGWSLQEGVRQLASNWVNFVFGKYPLEHQKVDT